MGVILNCIKQSSPKITTFESNKHVINENAIDFFGSYEDHSKSNNPPSRPKYAEMHPNTDCHFHVIDTDDIHDKHNQSKLKYFLDGSRHIYKTSDIIINGIVYPVVAGQIIVGCCSREGRVMGVEDPVNMFKREIVLALPDKFDIEKLGKNYFIHQKELMNKALRDKYNENAIQFSQIIPYNADEISNDDYLGRDKYLHRAISVIQNEMMDQEQLMVQYLCKTNLLGVDSWLVKDGTLEYKKDFSNRKDVNLDIAQYTDHIQHVIGVSKLFNAELLSYQEKKIGQIIAQLPPLSRTNAYTFKQGNHFYCIWYLRLRSNPRPSNHFSDVIKVEFIMLDEKPIGTQIIDNISKHLLNEAAPVCFGKDSRWANHLYPVYLTESYCKSKYIYDKKIINVI